MCYEKLTKQRIYEYMFTCTVAIVSPDAVPLAWSGVAWSTCYQHFYAASLQLVGWTQQLS